MADDMGPKGGPGTEDLSLVYADIEEMTKLANTCRDGAAQMRGIRENLNSEGPIPASAWGGVKEVLLGLQGVWLELDADYESIRTASAHRAQRLAEVLDTLADDIDETARFYTDNDLLNADQIERAAS